MIDALSMNVLRAFMCGAAAVVEQNITACLAFGFGEYPLARAGGAHRIMPIVPRLRSNTSLPRAPP